MLNCNNKNNVFLFSADIKEFVFFFGKTLEKTCGIYYNRYEKNIPEE